MHDTDSPLSESLIQTLWAAAVWAGDHLVMVSVLAAIAVGLALAGVWLAPRVAQALRARKLASVNAAAEDGNKNLGDTAVQQVAVIAAAVVAELLAIDGVRFAFSEAFSSDSLAAHGGFVVFTLALIVEGSRAARVYHLTGRVGADFYVAAGFAATAGLMAAWAEDTAHAAASRFVIALIAGVLVARGVVLRRAAIQAAVPADDQPTRRRPKLAWRLTPERVLAALRLVDPVERDVADVDRARKAAALARVSDKLEARSRGKQGWWSGQVTRRLRARQRAMVRKADAATWALARVQLAAMHKAADALSSKGVAHIDPWNPDDELQALLDGHLPAAPTSPAGPFLSTRHGPHPKPALSPKTASGEAKREASVKPAMKRKAASSEAGFDTRMKPISKQKAASGEAGFEAKPGLSVRPIRASELASGEAGMSLPANTKVRRWYQQRLRRGSVPALRDVAKRLGVKQKDAQAYVDKWSTPENS